MLYEKGVFKILQKLQEIISVGVFFLTKLQTLRPAALLEMRLQHKCFPVIFSKFLRTPFFKQHF